ncbi:MAG: ribosomal protein L11 methyltransferase, partial [Rhodospirillaceae bacterium]
MGMQDVAGRRDVWRIELTAAAAAVPAFEAALDQVGEAVLTFTTVDAAFWRLSAFCRGPPDRTMLAALLAVTAAAAGVAEPAFTIERVKARDWVAETLSTFPPLRVGRFYIHGMHVTTPPPAAVVSLLVDATMAFGSGEHQSTQGCLLAMDRLARGQCFHRVLDMGCGTGILGLAAAKVWRASVLAVDVDPSAVRVTAFNAHRNGVHRLMHAVAGNGFATRRHPQAELFDLILANIL